jgi:hypothetical protein
MIQAINDQHFEAMERPMGQMGAGRTDFAELFGDATKTAILGTAKTAAVANSAADPVSTAPAGQTTLGDPDVQGWLNSYYAEVTADNPLDTGSANTSYQPAPGAGNNYSTGTVYGPDAIYTQALANQNGNVFASLTGQNAASFTSQLPGVPGVQMQQSFDQSLALENAQRLASGQPIDTAAYWSNPGSISYDGTTYTSAELGYAGPGQSSGPEPIYIALGNQIPGTDTYSVPGYSGTVKGITPGFYTLQQLEQAGLKAGQPDAQIHPGSWTTSG